MIVRLVAGLPPVLVKGSLMKMSRGAGLTSVVLGLAAAVGLGYGGYTLLAGSCSSCGAAESTSEVALAESMLVSAAPAVETETAVEVASSCCAEDEAAEAVALAEPDCNQCDADMAKDCPMAGGNCEGDIANCPHATGDCPMNGAKDCPMGSMDNCPKQGAEDCPMGSMDNCPMKGTPDCPFEKTAETETETAAGNG